MGHRPGKGPPMATRLDLVRSDYLHNYIDVEEFERRVTVVLESRTENDPGTVDRGPAGFNREGPVNESWPPPAFETEIIYG